MARLAVKLLLLDEADRLLLIHAKDPQTQAECWYPVGGGIEPGFPLVAQELAQVTEKIFPPRLGELLRDLLTNGVPAHPIDISDANPSLGR